MNSFCSSCGDSLHPGGQFCGKCGAAIAVPAAAVPAPNAPSNKAAKVKFAIALALSLIIAGGGSGWLYWHAQHPASAASSLPSNSTSGNPLPAAKPLEAEVKPAPASDGKESSDTPAQPDSPPEAISRAPSLPTRAVSKSAVPEPPPIPLLPPVPTEQASSEAPPAPTSQASEAAMIPAVPATSAPQRPAIPSDNRPPLAPPLAQAPGPYVGPSSGDLAYSGPPVVQNGEIVFDGLPPVKLNLVYDDKVWEAHIQPGGRNTQRLVLRNKKPGTQKKCAVQWNVVQ